MVECFIGFGFGSVSPAKGFKFVAMENVDMRGGIANAEAIPDAEPGPPTPYMFKFVMTVLRGAFGIIPYMLPVPWYGMGAAIGI